MTPLLVLGALAAWEAFWWADRVVDRQTLYARALRHARSIGKPLVVVGAPDRGTTRGPGCGDLTIDAGPSSACPNFLRADITKRLPLPSDSAVVFVSCVLEYVSDLNAAWRELQRIAPNRVYVCRVQPWTLAAHTYPGARRVVDPSLCAPRSYRALHRAVGAGGVA